MSTGSVTVLVSFDRAAFVERTVASLLAQTHRATEIVVLDLGTDDTATRVRAAFGDEVDVLSTPGWSIPRVRNVALARTRSEFVALASSDTPSAPERLARQVEALERSPEAGLCHTDVSFVDESGAPTDLPAARRPAPRHGALEGGALARSLLLEGNPVLGATVMLRRATLEAVGKFDDTQGLSWDFDLWIRIALVASFVHLAEPLVAYRARTFAIPDDGAGRATERHAAALAKHARHTAAVLGIPRAALDRRRHEVLVEAATQHLMAGAPVEARRDLYRAVRLARPAAATATLLAATFAPPAALDWVRAARRKLRRQS